MRAVEALKRAVSPEYRRWSGILQSLTLDLASCGPLANLSPPDFLIAGIPRSGTALVTAALFQPPAVVPVMEPWDALRMPIADLVDSLREEVTSTGILSRGRLDVAALADGSVEWCRDRELPVPVDVDESTAIAVKLPGFWRYLDRLPTTRFVVCLRDPAEVLRSFAATGGRLRQGLEYDVPFYGDINADLEVSTSDLAVRRALLLERILEGIVPHLNAPNVFVARYERWFDDPDQVVRDLAEFLGVPLRPGLVTIRPSSSERADDPETEELIRRYVPSAVAAGYRS